MIRQLTRLIKLLLILAMVSLPSCSEAPPPAPKPQTVKIKTQRVKPTAKPAAAQSPQAAPAAAAAQSPQATPAAAAAAAETPKTAQSDQQEKPASDLIKESLKIASAYDPKGRFDPFEPLFKEKPEQEAVTHKRKGKKRVPQTPLERVALSQLKLTAIIRAPSGNRALVEDGTGKGYVISKGTYVGLNSGRVIEIDKDRVIIEEEIENVLGELTIQNSELKLQKPAGEL